jgi:hypothetical protein
MSNDDAYASFQCHGTGKYQVYMQAGNLIARTVAFLMLVGFQAYNKVLFNRKVSDNVNIIKGLVLPSYLPFLYFFMLFNLITALVGLINKATNPDPETVTYWFYPLSVGVTHWFLEGLAMFLVRFGAGFEAIRRSFRISLVWGLATTFWFFIIFSIWMGKFNKTRDSREDRDQMFGMFIAFELVLFMYYSAYAFIPSKYLYHRPAMTFYARFSAATNLLLVVVGAVYHEREMDVVCPGSIVAFIYTAFLQPIVIYKTLQIDSQYWQGLSPEAGNPLTEVWDHLGIETASSMAEKLESFGQQNSKLPIIHFGLTNFDKDLKFVAGGFSRVYFGTLRKQRVAFKILFAMELDPKDVEEFYREAAVLHALKHPNVVQCLGVCVMPPALTIVLELCKHGSLFDFLYKPVHIRPVNTTTRRSFGTALRDSLIGGWAQRDSDISSNAAGAEQSIEMSATAAAGVHPPADRTLKLFRHSDSDEEDGHATTTNPLAAATVSNNGAKKHQSGKAGKTIVPEDEMARREVDAPSRSGRKQNTLSKTMTSLLQGVGLRPPSSAFGVSKEKSHNGNANTTSRQSLGLDGKGDDAPTTTSRAAILSYNRRLHMMRDAVCGIAHLHSKGYLHCDIKSLNFLVGEVRSSILLL